MGNITRKERARREADKGAIKSVKEEVVGWIAEVAANAPPSIPPDVSEKNGGGNIADWKYSLPNLSSPWIRATPFGRDFEAGKEAYVNLNNVECVQDIPEGVTLRTVSGSVYVAMGKEAERVKGMIS